MNRVSIVAALLLLISHTGCARRMYQWSSDLGRQCFYECQRGRYQCNAGCFNNIWCKGACSNDETSCMNTCPDLMPVRPGQDTAPPSPGATLKGVNRICANADCTETAEQPAKLPTRP
jgi:hypothetical protein